MEERFQNRLTLAHVGTVGEITPMNDVGMMI